jgi:hypothetical protein
MSISGKGSDFGVGPMAPTRRRAWGSVVVGVAAGVVLALGGLSGSWNLLEHTICADQGQVSLEYFFLPALLVNSPYGGLAWGNGSMAASFPGGPGYPTYPGAYGGGSSNGTVGEVWFSVNLSIHGQANETEIGPGPSRDCTRPFSVFPVPAYLGRGFGGWEIQVPSNLTDMGEATSANFSGLFEGNPLSPIWNNGFTSSNAPNVSTCTNSTPLNLLIQVPGPSVQIPFSESGNPLVTSYILPFTESFHYLFPPRFGIWAVDNLSTPGGPGGGWAFDYLGPCT